VGIPLAAAGGELSPLSANRTRRDRLRADEVKSANVFGLCCGLNAAQIFFSGRQRHLQACMCHYDTF
jgi:hypothetical protein